jgi:acyl-CoA synthetase (AMP-forming)/AMP-acid ligase II/acyl carrier protein
MPDNDASGIVGRWINRSNENSNNARLEISEDVAFLQYTSGSTGAPRGVMVMHGNILSNAFALQQFSGLDCMDTQVCWLPHYHDMGLIGGIVLPLYCGFPSVLLEPAAFLQRPIRWMEEVSNRRATATSGPNFAYDLCARRTTPAQRATLDLRCLRLAVVGAEPVRADTLTRFNEAFGPCGFQPDSLRPCYGLAEATLLVAASDTRNGTIAPSAPRDPRLITSGRVVPGTIAHIVDPHTRRACPSGSIGEIWVSGPSVALGYWGRPDLTAEVFRATLDGSPDGPFFLRTGDLGFCEDDELYVTGRLKDLIIINGRNHYPQDIEQTAERSHPALQPCRSAAFSIEGNEIEKVILAAEISRNLRNPDIAQIAQAVRQALSEHHELELSGLVLLRPGSLPQTSSGKTQRHACRKGYLESTLDPIAVWAPAVPIPSAAGVHMQAKPGTERAIQEWLVARLVQRIGSSDPVHADTPFASCGLDSVAAVGLATELEAWLGSPIPPTLVYEHATPKALAAHLSRGWVVQKNSGFGESSPEFDQQARLAEVEKLSDDDAADLLAAEVADNRAGNVT